MLNSYYSYIQIKSIVTYIPVVQIYLKFYVFFYIMVQMLVYLLKCIYLIIF